MRLWAALWWLLVIHAIASFLFNRRNRIHSREFCGRNWIPQILGRSWAHCLVALSGYFYLRPTMGGVGTFLSAGPLDYVLSNALIEAKMQHSVIGALDAEIEGNAFSRRLGG